MMTIEERNRIIMEKMKKFNEEMLREPGAKERCRSYLISLGIYNEDGSLHKDYGGEDDI
jgi:hypothetical protein